MAELPIVGIASGVRTFGGDILTLLGKTASGKNLWTGLEHTPDRYTVPRRLYYASEENNPQGVSASILRGELIVGSDGYIRCTSLHDCIAMI